MNRDRTLQVEPPKITFSTASSVSAVQFPCSYEFLANQMEFARHVQRDPEKSLDNVTDAG